MSFPSDEVYQKLLHLNRMWLYGPNNLVPLSIPLSGGRNVRGAVRDIRIAKDTHWQRIHWRTIHDCYRKSPWFEEYESGLRSLYEDIPAFLLDWNLKTIRWCLSALKLKVDILSVSAFNQKKSNEGISQEPILEVPVTYPRYQQVFSDRRGFVGNLSILDLIFNCGPQSKHYLHQIAVYQMKGRIHPIQTENS